MQRLMCTLLIVLAAMLSISDYVRSAAPSYIGQASSDLISATGASNASLYNGQYARNFPLFSIGSPKRLNFDIALSYTGNVHSTEVLENRDNQASWVGLGFSLSMPSIFSDNNYTVDTADDKYVYVGPEGTIPLQLMVDNWFTTNTGLNWDIRRITGYSENLDRRYVAAWVIRKEDGSIHLFGDSVTSIDASGQPSIRNATRYSLAWGNVVGIGVTNDEELVPIQWDCSRIEDARRAHSLTFSYMQVTAPLLVLDPVTGNSVNSSYGYTRWSYLESINSSDGFKAEFALGDRVDYQPFKHNSQFEFYSTKRLDSITLKHTASNKRLHKVKLEYDYLNNTGPVSGKKLLLKEIKVFDSSGTDSLPSTKLSYYTLETDDAKGSLASIENPSGSIDNIVYRLIEPEKNFAYLNYADTNFTSANPGAARRFISHAWSRNCYIGKEKLVGNNQSFQVGSWRGYWEFQDLPDIDHYDGSGDLENRNFDVAASDDWVVFYKHDINKFIVLENSGGSWTRDTIPISWTPAAGRFVQIYAAQNSFVACELIVPVPFRVDSSLFRSAHYYAKSPLGWTEHEIVTRPDSYAFGGLQLSNDAFAFSIWYIEFGEAPIASIYFGKFDSKNGTLGVAYDENGGDWFNSLKWTTSLDAVAYCSGKPGEGNVKIVSFDGPNWDTTYYNLSYGFAPYLMDIIPIRSGFVLSVGAFTFPEVNPWVKSVHYILRKAGAWVTDYWGYNETWNNQISLQSSGGETFAFVKQNGITQRLYAASWNGADFNLSLVKETGTLQKIEVVVSDEICAGYFEDDHQLWASRIGPNKVWNSSELVLSNIAPDTANEDFGSLSFDASRDVVVFIGKNANSPTTKRRIISRWDGTQWEEFDVTSLTPETNYEFFPGPLANYSSASSISAAFADRVSFIVGYVSRAAFQFYNGTFTGKAIYPVLDRIESLKYPGDLSPRIVSFDYEGGILDDGASGPRFCMSKSSTPYYPGETPDGYNIQYYFNDIDDQGFIDGTIYDRVDIPDLEEEANSGLLFGGYLLDGAVYAALDSSSSDPSGKCFDSVISKYEIDFYKIGVDKLRINKSSVHTRSDSIPRTINYLHDGNNRLIRTEEITSDGIRRVDSTVYYDYVAPTNVFNKPKWQVKYADSAGTKQFLSKKYSEWTSDSTQILKRQMIWPDASSGVISDTTIGFEEFDFINSDVAETSGIPDVDTHFIEVTDVADSVKCEYLLAVNSVQPYEFSLIKWRAVDSSDFQTIDSLPSKNPINCKQTTEIQKAGEFFVNTGDSLMIILDNSDSAHCLGGGHGKGWARAEVDLTSYLMPLGGEIYTYSWILGIPGGGVDSFGNTYCWRTSNFDTMSTKYSPDGLYQIASISNAYYTDCYLYDAEFPFNAQDKSYDDWVNLAGSNGGQVDEESFSGKYSFKLQGDVAQSQTEGLYKSFNFSDLVRDRYYLSLWFKSTKDIHIEIALYSGGSECSISEKDMVGTGNWKKATLVFDKTTCTGADSGAIRISLNNVLTTDHAYIDDIRFHPISATMITNAFDPETGLKISSSNSVNIPTKFEYDSFLRQIKTLDYKNQIISEQEFYFSSEGNGGTYNPNDPNYVKTTVYDDGVPSISCTFFDGQGSTLQRRFEADFEGAKQTIVTDISDRDARNRPIKTYKSYVDLFGLTGVMDYTVDFQTEVNNFYNGTYGVNCNGIAYSETVYRDETKSRPLKSALPGLDRSITSSHTNDYNFYLDIINGDSISVSKVSDPDNIESFSLQHHTGRYSTTITPYLKPDLTIDSMIFTTYNDIMNQTGKKVISVKNGANRDEITLQEQISDDRGLTTWSKKVDYGEVRTIYDDAGNVRFVQNDKRKLDDKFVYYKYDTRGRLTEEGIMDNATINFSQDSADNRTFPDIALAPSIQYLWIYDFYVDGTDSLVAPGKLVYMQNGAQSYWKKYYYFPEDDSTLLVIKLPQASGSEKGIIHVYNDNGSLKRTTILPKYPLLTGKRDIEYEYDPANRVSTVKKELMLPLVSHHYAEYEYNPDGSISIERLGVYSLEILEPPQFDTVQVVNYSYDETGNLLSINDPSTVVASKSGGSESLDHFGQGLTFFNAQLGTGYYNGRIHKTTSAYSNDDPAPIEHKHEYNYNDLGWLKHADHQTDDSHDRRYFYDSFGRRDSVYGTDTTIYEYYTDTPGSSRLKRVSTMPIGDVIVYDTLGNLLADTARELYLMYYDHRNLLTWAKIAPNISTAFNTLVFEYDETGQRIKKRHDYQYWDDCFEPPAQQSVGSGGGIQTQSSGDTQTLSSGPGGGQNQSSGPGSGPGQCAKWTYSEIFYLYDGGNLVATFDKNDNVIDMFIYGPGGRIASYSQNDDNLLHYYMTDHLGSTRILMRGSPPAAQNPYFVTQAYTYHPFGDIIEAIGNQNTPMQFTGKEHDIHSSFDFEYFGARYYDPQYGIFTTLDPAGQFAHGYVYGGNNPISTIDPDGRFVMELFSFGIAAYGLFQQSQAGYYPVGYDKPSHLQTFLPFVASFFAIGGFPFGIPSFYNGTSMGLEILSVSATAAANNLILGEVLGNGPKASSVFLSSAMAGASAAISWNGTYETRMNGKIRKLIREYADRLGESESSVNAIFAGSSSNGSGEKEAILARMRSLQATGIIANLRVDIDILIFETRNEMILQGVAEFDVSKLIGAVPSNDPNAMFFKIELIEKLPTAADVEVISARLPFTGRNKRFTLWTSKPVRYFDFEDFGSRPDFIVALHTSMKSPLQSLGEGTIDVNMFFGRLALEGAKIFVPGRRKLSSIHWIHGTPYISPGYYGQ